MAIYNGGLNIIAPDTYSKNEINDLIADNTRSNLLRPILKTTTQHGITCTNNGDGTFTVNGTAANNAVFVLTYVDRMSGYKLTGCPTNNSGSYLAILRGSIDAWTNVIMDTGNGAEISLDTKNNPVIIAVAQGLTVNNIVFKPMITDDLSATYDDFVSYNDSFIMGINGGINLDLLWANANPNASFAEQTLALNISDYKLLVVVSLPSSGNIYNMLTNLLVVNSNQNRISLSYYNNDTTISRVYELNLNAGSIIISDGTLNSSSDNTRLIPYQIYGVK